MAVRSHAQLAAENLFLRNQLALYLDRQVKPRRADDATRIAPVALAWLVDWRHILTVVKPDTLIRWHRKGFQLFWRCKSRPRGRPKLPTGLQRLIAEMTAANQIDFSVATGSGVLPVSFWKMVGRAWAETRF